MSEALIKRRRGRPNGSYTKPQASRVLKRMPPQDRAFLKEAHDGDLYPLREHKVVERACAAIETETGIVVAGGARLLLYAVHQSFVAWTIYDHRLNGLYGLPSTCGAGKGKRRAQVFRYLKYAFEAATGGKAPRSCNQNGGPFFRFARVALIALAPRGFMPGRREKTASHALAKAIENALTPLEKRLGPLAGKAKLTVKFPSAN